MMVISDQRIHYVNLYEGKITTTKIKINFDILMKKSFRNKSFRNKTEYCSYFVSLVKEHIFSLITLMIKKTIFLVQKGTEKK